jgi:hypothetical protein
MRHLQPYLCHFSFAKPQRQFLLPNARPYIANADLGNTPQPSAARGFEKNRRKFGQARIQCIALLSPIGAFFVGSWRKVTVSHERQPCLQDWSFHESKSTVSDTLNGISQMIAEQPKCSLLGTPGNEHRGRRKLYAKQSTVAAIYKVRINATDSLLRDLGTRSTGRR